MGNWLSKSLLTSINYHNGNENSACRKEIIFLIGSALPVMSVNLVESLNPFPSKDWNLFCPVLENDSSTGFLFAWICFFFFVCVCCVLISLGTHMLAFMHVLKCLPQSFSIIVFWGSVSYWTWSSLIGLDWLSSNLHQSLSWILF